jgi:tripartite-type tricarboxylate transporter receptor subunit TctC
MKKFFKLGLVVAMAASVMITAAGCQQKNGGTSPDGQAGTGTRTPAKKEVVKIICPYGVGGTADAIARRYAKVAGDLFPEFEFVVEQKTGGDGFVGAAYFESVDPSKKELFMLGYGVAYRHEIGKTYGTEQVPFDLKKLKPVAAIDDRTWILYGKPGDTLENILAQAKAGTLKMSGGNPLSDPHLALGSLLAVDGGKVTVVSYDGGAAQKQGLVSGEVGAFVGTTQAGREEVEAGILIPILAFSENGYEGLKGPNGAISVPGLVKNKHTALDANKDYSGSILPAGGFITARAGADQAWVDKVAEITKAVWNSPEYADWMKEIGLNRFEVYGNDAQAYLDSAIQKAISAFKLLSGK